MENQELKETYKSYSLCGKPIEMDLFCKGQSVDKVRIGTRFDYLIHIDLSRYDTNVVINLAFNFFNNYACLLNVSEIKTAWALFKKANDQRWDSVDNAFWNYMDGKRIKFCDRKKTVFQWV